MAPSHSRRGGKHPGCIEAVAVSAKCLHNETSRHSTSRDVTCRLALVMKESPVRVRASALRYDLRGRSASAKTLDSARSIPPAFAGEEGEIT
jgi:hypothetical protein